MIVFFSLFGIARAVVTCELRPMITGYIKIGSVLHLSVNLDFSFGRLYQKLDDQHSPDEHSISP